MADKRILAYVSTSAKVTDAVKTAYANSMIFVGDEKQIFVPSLNAYVGVGETRFSNAYTYLDNAYQYTLGYITSEIAAVKATANENNVTAVNGMIQDITVAGANTAAGNFITTSDALSAQYTANTVADTLVTLENGISVSSETIIKKGEATGDPVTFTGTSDLTAASGIYKLTATQFAQAKETIKTNGWEIVSSTVTIDDKNTIELVKDAIAYNTTFTQYWANNQINRLYSEILGADYIPVDLDKYDTIASTGAAYIKLKATSTTSTSADKVTTTTNTKAVYVPVTVAEDGTVTITEAGAALKYDKNVITLSSTGAKTVDATQETVPVLGNDYEKDGDKYVLYTANPNAGSTGQNIATGISTIKEIASILDQITDGSEDGGIALTNNIAQNAKDIAVLKADFATAQAGAVNSVKSDSAENDYVSINVTGTGDTNKYGNVGVSASVDTVATSEITTVAANAISATTDRGIGNTAATDMYTVTGVGLIDASALNTYVSKTYDYLVQVINNAEDATASYVLGKVNTSLETLDFDSTAKNAENKMAYVIGGATANETSTAGLYIKEVKQVDGQVSAMYGRFAAKSNTYSGETKVDSYQYVKLTTDGDNFVATTYTHDIETATTYGYVADAKAVNDYTAYLLSWVVIE